MMSKVLTITIVVRREDDRKFSKNEITRFEDRLTDIAEEKDYWISSTKIT